MRTTPALTGWLLALPALLFTALLLALPLGRTLLEGGVNLSVWQDPYFLGRLGWTLAQAAGTAGLALLVGAPLAYLLSRHEVPGKRLFLRLLLLPFVTPTLVAVLGLTALAGPQGWLTRWTGLDLSDTPALLIWGNLFFNLPVMVRLAYGGFSRVSPGLLGAARSLGASGLRAAWDIALPLALPGLAAGAVLVFLYSALSFGLPLALGGEKYATLEVEIYALTALQLRLSEASALIVGQLVLTLAATWLYTRLTRGGAGVAVGGLPRARGGALAGVLVLGGLTLLVCFGPLLAVVVRGLVGTAGPTGLYWRGVLGDEQTPLLLGNTLRFGALALLGATLLGGLYALGAWLARSRVLDLVSLLPLMVSPVSLAVGYLLAYPVLAATLPMLIAAYTLLALPLLVRSLLPALRAIPPRLLEAARTLGASPLAAHRTVTLPLTLPALRGGAALALATVLGEFGATLVLTRPEWATLSTGLYERLGRPGERNLGEACALATMLLLLSATAFTVLDGGEGEVT
ncbi:ABC transporter permease [Deinococcus wulumuqiensis]|uniref:ABC transporter permease n=1 Tax=Deinococcus wulumuqiensis TaxID=980427 RepID=A0AAV4K7C5_9DEIO|nr:iron ABC transporter permease [Deinococcus wulumuqiensis]QII21438.1 iron ABC transporter permease [Deinococcus wulumuqiensis R12]GGI90799.1 ABC transporter permease [Deinococcus wulumuqiensis]GGP30856.1 ABC transporter permease [Deinococcus wulumuqiensis]